MPKIGDGFIPGAGLIGRNRSAYRREVKYGIIKYGTYSY